MKLPVHIQFNGMMPSAALEAFALEHAYKLDQFSTDLMSCRVSIDLEHKHQQHGRHYGVRIDLTLPAHELVVSRIRNEDAYVAVRDAFERMQRQLEEAVRKRRGSVKQHTEPIAAREPPDAQDAGSQAPAQRNAS
jgi:ribosomal subunit interface protein